MEIAINSVLFIHLLGMAGLLGGTLAQLKAKPKRVTNLMLHSALTQLVTGFILTGLVQANKEEIRMPIVGLKMLFVLIILLLLILARKKPTNAKYYTILGLTIANVGLALFVTNQ